MFSYEIRLSSYIMSRATIGSSASVHLLSLDSTCNCGQYFGNNGLAGALQVSLSPVFRSSPADASPTFGMRLTPLSFIKAPRPRYFLCSFFRPSVSSRMRPRLRTHPIQLIQLSKTRHSELTPKPRLCCC